VKLIDVPEMGYTRTDRPWPRGEVVVRTPGMATGYYKVAHTTRSHSHTPHSHTHTICKFNRMRKRLRRHGKKGGSIQATLES